MTHQSNRKIITNRQLNFTLSPVDKHNPKVMPYKLPNYEIDGIWNQHHSIVLDVLLDSVFKGYYERYRNIPKSWRSKSVIEVNKRIAGGIFTPIALRYLSKHAIEGFSLHEGYDVQQQQRELYESEKCYNNIEVTFEEYFNGYLENNENYKKFEKEMHSIMQIYNLDVVCNLKISNIFKNYKIVQQYKQKFVEYVRKIEETKFKMNHKVKCIVKEPEYNGDGKRTHAGKLIDDYYAMDTFQQIFLAKIDNDTLKLNFKSPLGKIILHNTLILDTDWISEEVFKLRKNAYFLYKRFVLNRIASKNPPREIILWFEDIKTFLDIHSNNKSDIYKAINSAFEDMKQKGLIKNFSWNKNYSKQRQYKLTFDDQRKTKGDKRSKKQQLLRFKS